MCNKVVQTILTTIQKDRRTTRDAWKLPSWLLQLSFWQRRNVPRDAAVRTSLPSQQSVYHRRKKIMHD